MARSTAEAIPDGRLRVIPGAGHLSAVEAPDAFARTLAELLDEL